MKFVLLLLVGLLLGFVLWVRLAKDDPQIWHVDPLTATRGGKKNSYILLAEKSPVFERSAADLAMAFDDIAMAAPNVRHLAGSVEELWITYVQRSPKMGYPDYISVKFIGNTDGTASLAVYSRSRFGRSDLGVNRTRIKTWIKALGQVIVAR